MTTKKMSRVMVVDDDRDILDLIKYNLEVEGFQVEVVEGSNDAIEMARNFEPDLIILDILMPDINGLELCSRLRKLPQFEETYIFFLTALSDYYHQAIETGGDDFIEKAVGLRSLAYKVSAVLKKQFVIRKRIRELDLGWVKIMRDTESVSINSNVIPLSHPEFELLFFFAQNPRKNITPENLVKNIWGSDTFMRSTSIETYIESIVKKLGINVIHLIEKNRYRFGLES